MISRWEQQVKKESQRKMETHDNMLCSCGNSEMDGEAWLLDDPHKAETS
jgi:hypothetical protein